MFEGGQKLDHLTTVEGAVGKLENTFLNFTLFRPIIVRTAM